ncbi:hypothetical protein GCM10020256_44840 [Streptomyces thermocoprophilus]
MEMKEFHYEDGLRVSLFNLDHKAVPYHFHNEVSDLMYCSRGVITVELPDSGEVFTVRPGEMFQVPLPQPAPVRQRRRCRHTLPVRPVADRRLRHQLRTGR